jgi:hypothetical protein
MTTEYGKYSFDVEDAIERLRMDELFLPEAKRLVGRLGKFQRAFQLTRGKNRGKIVFQFEHKDQGVQIITDNPNMIGWFVLVLGRKILCDRGR